MRVARKSKNAEKRRRARGVGVDVIIAHRV